MTIRRSTAAALPIDYRLQFIYQQVFQEFNNLLGTTTGFFFINVDYNSGLQGFSVCTTCCVLLKLNTAHWIIDGTAVPFQHHALSLPPPLLDWGISSVPAASCALRHAPRANFKMFRLKECLFPPAVPVPKSSVPICTKHIVKLYCLREFYVSIMLQGYVSLKMSVGYALFNKVNINVV